MPDITVMSHSLHFKWRQPHFLDLYVELSNGVADSYCTTRFTATLVLDGVFHVEKVQRCYQVGTWIFLMKTPI